MGETQDGDGDGDDSNDVHRPVLSPAKEFGLFPALALR